MKQKIYRDILFRMSNKKMADVMYAILMTDATLVTSFGIGIYKYNRKQNGYNQVEAKILIEPAKIEQFEEISGVVLEKPQVVMGGGGSV